MALPAPATNFSLRRVYFMEEKELERQWVERCLRGDLDAFGSLIERYERQIFRAVYNMVGNFEDAQEIAQQVFMKAFEHLAGYDRERKFFSWLYRIAINESINFMKARKKFESLGEVVAEPHSEPFETIDRTRAVQQAVLSLKPEYRAVIVLYHYSGCSYQDAAEVLDLPEKTVKSRLFTARQLLKQMLTPALAKSGSGAC